MKIAVACVLFLSACSVHTSTCRVTEVEGCDPAKPWTCQCSERAGGGTDDDVSSGGTGVDTPDDPDTDQPDGDESGGSSDGDNGGDSGGGDDGGSDDPDSGGGSVGDHDKGHGNDEDGHDEDNPGKGHDKK